MCVHFLWVCAAATCVIIVCSSHMYSCNGCKMVDMCVMAMCILLWVICVVLLYGYRLMCVVLLYGYRLMCVVLLYGYRLICVCSG